ncbi:hypothetical protein ACVWYH_001271 [Bradyrhizobium sp. GM24.11]
MKIATTLRAALVAIAALAGLSTAAQADGRHRGADDL